MDTLIENIFKIESNPFLADVVMQNYGLPWDEIGSHFVHVVYPEKRPQWLFYCRVMPRDTKPDGELSFVEEMQSIDKTDF